MCIRIGTGLIRQKKVRVRKWRETNERRFISRQTGM